jgi:hypothetical protein
MDSNGAVPNAKNFERVAVILESLAAQPEYILQFVRANNAPAKTKVDVVRGTSCIIDPHAGVIEIKTERK